MPSVVPGAPDEARWIEPEPRRTVSDTVLERMVRAAFPRGRAIEVQPLAAGRRNANFKLRLDCIPEPIVLRIYEHHASLCQKEIDLLRLVCGSVPVPELIHVEPRGLDDLPPFTLARFVEGVSFRDLARAGDPQAIAQAAFSAGETLAAIGTFAFPQAGWLGPGPSVTAPLLEGPDPLPKFVNLCLASPDLRKRMPSELRDRVHALAWPPLPEEARLVHGDFNKRNLLVHPTGERWRVAAVLDWEFAVAASPLADVGNFLRYERASRLVAEPHFSAGYRRGGGTLPPGWRRLARWLDLAALCESLTRVHLPDDVAAELVELVRATVEDRDPRFA